MELFDQDFHDSDSSYDEMLDFEEQESVQEPCTFKIEEKEDFYRSLDEY